MRAKRLTSLILALSIVAGCSTVSRPLPDPEPVREIRPQDALDTACMAQEPGVYTFVRRLVVCEHRPFLESRALVIDQWADLVASNALLTEAGISASADSAVAAGKLAAETARADKAESDRWTWGGVGIGIGVVLTAIAAGLIAGYK